MRIHLFAAGKRPALPLVTGFIGEVAAADFVTGDALAGLVGLTAGASINSAIGWLKFVDPDDNKTKYVAKRALRNNLNWISLNNLGIVFGSKTVEIGGKTYKVRLIKGAAADPSTAVDNSSDHVGTHGSEWNRLIYRIVDRADASQEGITFGEWATYTEVDLAIGAGRPGSAAWCQETGAGGNSSKKLTRGYSTVLHAMYISPSSSHAGYGWRPVLELVE